MLVLGVNKGATAKGKILHQGGVAISSDGRIVFALAEERASGKKWAGGFEKSLPIALEATTALPGQKQALRLEDFDRIAISTCCEGVPASTKSVAGLPDDQGLQLMAVDHHYSHAAAAYFPSPFKRAVVMVIDSGGNTFGQDPFPDRWWEVPRQQHSYYIGSGNSLKLVDRDFFEPFETGLGEIYRAFTLFLGFESSANASKTMALSAYGKPSRLDRKRVRDFVQIERGKLSTPVTNMPLNPEAMVYQLGERMDIDFGEPRVAEAEFLPIHKDIAAYVQRNLEFAMLEKARWLMKMHRIRHLCVSGGVALNCVANGKLAQLPGIKGLYVPSAPGDDGQALGNALTGAAAVGPTSAPRNTRLTRSSDVQLGPTYMIDSKALVTLLRSNGLADAIVFETRSLPKVVAQLINFGCTVCVFQGRSELGPRALGNRSILGKATDITTRIAFNQLKRRDWFQPVAPSLPAEEVNLYFTSKGRRESPFMSLALQSKPGVDAKLRAVVHDNNTARVQTVDPGNERGLDSFLRQVLDEVKRLPATGVVANTSFNERGSPIVETPDQAVATFKKLGLNALAIGRFLVLRKLIPQCQEMGLLGDAQGMRIRTRVGGKETTMPSELTIPAAIRWIQSHTGQVIFVRHEVPLFKGYLEWLLQGRKISTIRYRPGAVEIPRARHLPLSPTKKFEDPSKLPTTLEVGIGGVDYTLFGDLTEEDAKRDGFESLEAMRKDLRAIYPPMRDDHWVTVYSLGREG